MNASPSRTRTRLAVAQRALPLLLTLVAAHSHAALRVGNPTAESVAAGNTPELALVIWDPVKEVSYTRDLGINAYGVNYALGNTATNLFVYGQQDAGYQKLFDPINTDPNFLTFLTRSTDRANQLWAVIAVTSDTDVIPLAQDATSIYTTLNADSANGVTNPEYTRLLNWINQDMVNAAGSFQTFAGQFNLLGGSCAGACLTDYAANASSFSAKGSLGYAGDAFVGGTISGGGGNAPKIFNSVNRSSWFYSVTAGSDNGTDVPITDEFDNLGHDAYWGLGVDANGNYILSYTMEAAVTQARTAAGALLRLRTDYAASYGRARLIDVPAGAVTAVPEPATWGLMGLGLAVLAARARRRA